MRALRLMNVCCIHNILRMHHVLLSMGSSQRPLSENDEIVFCWSQGAANMQNVNSRAVPKLCHRLNPVCDMALLMSHELLDSTHDRGTSTTQSGQEASSKWVKDWMLGALHEYKSLILICLKCRLSR